MDGAKHPDLIVLGAGAAGCVIASGLARRTGRRVLLVEAGPDLRDATPTEWHDGWRLPSVPDWGYTAEAPDGSPGSALRRGRLVGGTSWLTRFAVRGSPADFDAWAASGNPGWSFEEVLPVFRRIEADRDFGAAAWHGHDGPLPISRYPELDLALGHAAVVAGFEAAGLEHVADHNRPGAIGIGRLPMSSLDGRRITPTGAWLDDARERLTILADTSVDRIELTNGRATGVKLVDGTRIHADAVVICAGTYGSPILLLRSGIGPAEHLRAVGIEVAVDLPGVGENLADHPAVELPSGVRGSGLTSGPVLHSIATWRSSIAASDGPPDLMSWITDPIEADPIVWLDAILLKPTSRGSVRLRSADPTEPPRIRLPGLATDADLARIEEGLRFLSSIAHRPEIRGVATEPAPTLPEAAAGLRRYVAENAYSLPHVVGTCAMGPDPTAGAVVDGDARVHGVAGLSVVDASILPDPPSGFPHLITLMAAERLLDRWIAAG